APASGDLKDFAGTLTVYGGADATTNVVVDDRLDPSAATYTVTSSGVQSTTSAPIVFNNVQNVTLLGGGKGNTYNVQNTAAGATTTIDSGSGANVVNVGSLEPMAGGILDDIQGTLTLQGSGSDILNVDDTGSAGPKTGTLTATALTGLGMGPVGIAYTGFSTLDLHLGSGTDTFTIQSTSAATVVNSGPGNDTVNVLGTGAA